MVLMSLRRLLGLFVMVGAIVGIVGCATLNDPVQTEFDADVDFSRFRSFVVEPARPQIEPVQVGQPLPGIDGKIYQAIEQTLSGKGLIPDPDNPDLKVRYITQMRYVTQVDVEQVPTGQGIWTKYLSEPVSEGRLLVNLVDNRTGKVVWKAVTAGQVDPAKRPSQAAVDQLVEQLFAKFPPQD